MPGFVRLLNIFSRFKVCSGLTSPCFVIQQELPNYHCVLSFCLSYRFNFSFKIIFSSLNCLNCRQNDSRLCSSRTMVNRSLSNCCLLRFVVNCPSGVLRTSLRTVGISSRLNSVLFILCRMLVLFRRDEGMKKYLLLQCLLFHNFHLCQ